MAVGKYSRVDGRKSSNCCSTTSLVVFVAFCLIGVWMLMSTVVPIQNQGSSSEETMDEVNRQVITEKNSKQFEDSSGELSGTVAKEDENGSGLQSESHLDIKNDQNVEDGSVNTTEEKQEEVVSKEGSEEKTGPESDNGGEGNQQEKLVEERSDETPSIEEGKKTEEITDQEASSGDGESNSEAGRTEVEESSGTKRSGEETSDEVKQEEEATSQTETEKVEKDQEESDTSGNTESQETTAENEQGTTEVVELQNEKETQESSSAERKSGHHEWTWKVCDVTAGPDYIPCLDNWGSIKKLPGRCHYEHRERHCPDEAPTCLVPLPEGYKGPIQWPTSRYGTTMSLTRSSQKLRGTKIGLKLLSLPDIARGKRSRVILDVGCGVASFRGFLYERDVLAMLFAPKDEHEAQEQFALERGIPAISAVMGGKLLMELNRVLQPGGYFVWSTTAVYQKLPEDVGIWKAMSKLTKSMCWDLVVIKNDKLNGVAAAIYRKPYTNECYNKRSRNDPPLCSESDFPNASWNVTLEACMHKSPGGCIRPWISVTSAMAIKVAETTILVKV